MICELIMIGALAIKPCNIQKMEPSFSDPNRCYVVDNRGERDPVAMSCQEVFRIARGKSDD